MVPSLRMTSWANFSFSSIGIWDRSLAIASSRLRLLRFIYAQDLQLRRGIHEKHEVEFILHAHFQKQRDIGQDDRPSIFPDDLFALLPPLLEYRRVHNAFEQLAPLLIDKDKGAEFLPVDPVFGVQDIPAECCDDVLPDRLPRFLQDVDKPVVINDPGPFSDEHPDHRRFSGGNPTCKPHVQHRHASTTGSPLPSTQKPGA